MARSVGVAALLARVSAASNVLAAVSSISCAYKYALLRKTARRGRSAVPVTRARMRAWRAVRAAVFCCDLFVIRDVDYKSKCLVLLQLRGTTKFCQEAYIVYDDCQNLSCDKADGVKMNT